MSQTTVPALAMTIGVPGQLYQPGPEALIDSGHNEEASNPMAFGIVLARGAEVDGYIEPAGATDAAKACGLLLHSHAYARSTDGTVATGDLIATGVLPNGKLNVLRKGRAYVRVEQTVVAGDTTLRVRHTAGAGGTVVGAIRKDAVANETLSLGRVAQVIVGASAGGLAVISFNFEDVAVGAADT
jgi:hypothetical protein